MDHGINVSYRNYCLEAKNPTSCGNPWTTELVIHTLQTEPIDGPAGIFGNVLVENGRKMNINRPMLWQNCLVFINDVAIVCKDFALALIPIATSPG